MAVPERRPTLERMRMHEVCTDHPDPLSPWLSRWGAALESVTYRSDRNHQQPGDHPVHDVPEDILVPARWPEVIAVVIGFLLIANAANILFWLAGSH